jgi:hypothetical protein
MSICKLNFSAIIMLRLTLDGADSLLERGKKRHEGCRRFVEPQVRVKRGLEEAGRSTSGAEGMNQSILIEIR